MCLFVRLFAYYLYLFIHLLIYLFACLFGCLFICVFFLPTLRIRMFSLYFHIYIYVLHYYVFVIYCREQRARVRQDEEHARPRDKSQTHCCETLAAANNARSGLVVYVFPKSTYLFIYLLPLSGINPQRATERMLGHAASAGPCPCFCWKIWAAVAYIMGAVGVLLGAATATWSCRWGTICSCARTLSIFCSNGPVIRNDCSPLPYTLRLHRTPCALMRQS